MFDDLLEDLKNVHSAEVKGDMRLGAGVAADCGQYRLGEVRPAVGDGVADRRIVIDVAGH
jgi:hypothetical protein